MALQHICRPPQSTSMCFMHFPQYTPAASTSFLHHQQHQSKHSGPRRRSCCGINIALAQVHQEERRERGFAGREYLERCLEAAGALDLASSSSSSSPSALAGPWPIGTLQEAAALIDNRSKPTQLKRVAYQGNPGGYSHAMVDEAYGAHSAEAIPCVEMEAVFKAVETWVADAALIPIQNNLDGSIHRNFDLLLRHHQLHIVGELAWHVKHCLLAHPHASMSTLRRVVGHPQALSHCHETLTVLGLEPQEIEETAHAAALVACSHDTALVASSKAAHVFGLRLLRSSIQDDSQNLTRFLQLERQSNIMAVPAQSSSQYSHAPCKTTIAFALRNGPSDLCRVMSAFAVRNIRITNLESRPASPSIIKQMMMPEQREETAPLQPFKYAFVLDIEAPTGSQHSTTLKALRQVQELCSFYRVLGSYAVLQH